MRKRIVVWIVILIATFLFFPVAESEGFASMPETDIAAETLYWTRIAAYGS